MFAVHAIVRHRIHNRFPSFRFNLPARTGSPIVVRRHLRQDPIAQSQGRVAKSFQVQALQQFVVDRSAGHDDFRASWTDAFNFPPLRYGQPRNALGHSGHVGAGDDVSLPALVAAEMARHRCE